MHIVLYYTHDTTIVSSDPVIYYLILAILVRAQNNFVPDFTGTGNTPTTPQIHNTTDILTPKNKHDHSHLLCYS